MIISDLSLCLDLRLFDSGPHSFSLSRNQHIKSHSCDEAVNPEAVLRFSSEGRPDQACQQRQICPYETSSLDFTFMYFFPHSEQCNSIITCMQRP